MIIVLIVMDFTCLILSILNAWDQFDIWWMLPNREFAVVLGILEGTIIHETKGKLRKHSSNDRPTN